MKRVKVLFLTACTGRGGAGNSLFYLLKYLDRRRIEPLVVMPREGPILEKLAAHNIRYRLMPRLRERFFEMRFRRKNALTRLLSLVMNAADSGLFILELTALISRERVDLVHCNHMMVKFMGAFAALLNGVPAVLHCRTIYGSALRRWAFNQVARLPGVARVIAVSRAAAANFPSAAHKVAVVYNGADLAYFDPDATAGCLRREFGIPEGAAVVGYMGRIVQWKGIDNLLAAAQQILARRAETVFVIMGDNPCRSSEDLLARYRREAGDRRLAGRILFTGFRQDVRPCLKDIDVMLVPSVSPDPCPRAVIESLAFGIPVVGSAVGGIPELIRDGRTGFLVDPRGVSELVEKTLQILDDGELRHRMGRAALEDARARHDARAVAGNIQRLLLDAVAGEGAGGSGT